MTDFSLASADRTHPVLVTGANGYVGAWICRRLLEEGFTVHAAVRDIHDPRRTAHLTAMAQEIGGTLKLYAADLTTPNAYAEAMKGCGVVIHSAARFSTHGRDAMADYVRPALEGTRNVLASVNATPSVTRVVMTSSCAAIYGDVADVAAAPGGVLTEAVWNGTSTVEHSPYSYSKRISEEAAWDIARAQDRWRLVVINPALVVGPALSDKPDSGSFEYLHRFRNGALRMGAPHLEIGMVDVRDVAEAHLRAAFLPDAEGRHILCEGSYSMLDTGRALARHFRGYPFPRFQLPNAMVRVMAPLMDRTVDRRFIQRNIGHAFRADNTKSRRALGIEYRNIDAAVVEMFAQMTGATPR